MDTSELRRQLETIEPNVYESVVSLYPCEAVLNNGGTVPRFYFVDVEAFRTLFRGEEPGCVTGLVMTAIDRIRSVASSPDRLPAKFANRIYRYADHWGYREFTLSFSFWRRRTYAVTGFLDFLDYPHGLGPDDVAGIVWHPSWRGSAGQSIQVPFCVFPEPLTGEAPKPTV